MEIFVEVPEGSKRNPQKKYMKKKHGRNTQKEEFPIEIAKEIPGKFQKKKELKKSMKISWKKSLKESREKYQLKTL